VLVTRWFTIPKLFSNGRYGLFWLVSVIMLFTATSIEVLLVIPDVQNKVYFTHGHNFYYLPYIFSMVLFRDSCFFAWFLVFRLYTLQKDTFRAKQRASVMEHQSVQFSTPDQKEISIPIDIMVFIQEVDHTTQVHCTQDNVVTVTEPLSHCKKMIPTTLWASEGSDKMVFHQHLSEFLQTQNKPKVREIKYITLLSERQFRIFEIIRQHPGCNTTFLHESFRRKVTQRTIERDLEDMREKSVISHVGDKKTGGYEICTLNVISME
jgi:predicted double-glycine peptidase